MTGKRFEFPDGGLYEVIVSAESTAGARSEVQVTLPPKAMAPPRHIHPRQQESCIVGEGALEVLVGHQWRTLLAGEEIAIPAGTAHTFRNPSDVNASFRCVHMPALGFQEYLERLYWLKAMNRISGSRDLGSMLYSSLLLDLHRGDQLPAGMGARLGVRVLAPVARLLGMRVERPVFSRRSPGPPGQR